MPSIRSVEFGGISDLDYAPKNDVYYGVSDDRSEYGPARFYVLKLKIDAKGVHGLDIVRTVPLKDAAGKEFAKDDIDPESMRFDPDNGHLFWSSEGDSKGVPAIYEAGGRQFITIPVGGDGLFPHRGQPAPGPSRYVTFALPTP